MSDPAVQLSLPEGLFSFVEQRVRDGAYADAGEYLRDLVRRDREDDAARRLRSLIEEGLASGPARPMTEADWVELRTRALGPEA